MRSPLVPVVVAWIAGCVVAMCLHLTVAWSMAVACATTILACCLWRRDRLAPWALLVAIASIGVLRCALAQSLPPHHIAHLATDAPQTVQLAGVVLSDPAHDTTSYGAARTTLVLNATAMQHDADWRVATGRIQVRVNQPRIPLTYGDELLLEGTLQRPRAAGNRGSYDTQRALARQRIHAQLFVRPHNAVHVIARGHGHPLFHAAYRVRARARGLLHRLMAPDAAGFLSTVLLGERSQLPSAWRDAFQRTGTIHVIAISGLHVGILVVSLIWLLRMIWVPRAWRIILTMLFIAFFACLTGGRAPVVRAAVMTWVILGGLLLHRHSTIYNSLALAALMLLAWNPLQLTDPGFQLSFIAVIAIVAIAPRLRVTPFVAVSLAAWVGVAPLILHHFGFIAPIGVVANLVVIPLICVILIGGCVLLVVGSWSGGIGLACGWLMTQLITGCVSLVNWFATIPGGGWSVAPIAWWSVIALYAGMILTCIRGRLRWPVARVIGMWLALLNVWIWGGAILPAPSTLRVTALDVGHGDAILVEFPQRGRLLIDGGPHGAGRWTIAPYLRARGIRRLDAVLLTHPDGDHVGGLAYLLSAFDVGAVIDAGAEKATAGFDHYRALIQARRIPHYTVQRGDQLAGFGDVTIEVLHPAPPDAFRPNDRSVIVRLQHGRRAWLFSGDADEQGLATLLAREPRLAVDVLKVPHHGSDLGRVTQQFFERTEPTIALISMRAHSSKPLPHVRTLAALDRVGATWYLTGRDGAITITSDGESLDISTHLRDEHSR